MSRDSRRGPPPAGIGRPAQLEVDRDRATITFRRLLHHPIHDVWTAITDPKELETWFLARVVREDRPGGRLDMEHPNGIHATGQVREWNPPHVYEYEWNVPVGPYLPEGEVSVVRWELSPSDAGTLLVMSHRKLTRATAETFARGFRVLLDRLSAHLDGSPLPEPSWVAQS